MKTSNPLETLIEESRKARDQAGRALAEERRGEQQAAAQLDALERYKQEYNRQLQEALSRGVDAITLDNYRRFIGSLEDAIGRAGDNLQQHSQQVSVSQQHWRQQQKQLSSYNTLAGRRAAREQIRLARQEQRGNDELSNNAQARQRTRTAHPDTH